MHKGTRDMKVVVRSDVITFDIMKWTAVYVTVRFATHSFVSVIGTQHLSKLGQCMWQANSPSHSVSVALFLPQDILISMQHT